MAIHRMRTVQEALEEILKADARSAVTANCIRTLCKNGEIRCIHTGKKILVDLDDLLAMIGAPETLKKQTKEKQIKALRK